MKISLLIFILLFQTACATLLGPSEQAKAIADNDQESGYRQPRYSENPHLGATSDRQYRKMTRSRMEEESELQANAGSMWLMEGQTSYLFSQNKMRKEGDVLNVNLDPNAQKQVETKVQVIKKLLKQLEDQQKSQIEMLLSQNSESTDGERSPSSVAEGAAKPKTDAADKANKPESEANEISQIGAISTRIVEKLADGNYRVRGAQPFMIGKREYKVLVTGLLRPEDFNDTGVSSDKLLDPQYDVVSLRRKDKNDKTSLY